MIVIRNIDYIETDRDPLEIVSTSMSQDFVGYDSKDEVVTAKVLTELIRGQRFRRPDGTDIIVGLSKQAQDIIGIQYEAWELNEKAFSVVNNQAIEYADKIQKSRNAALWTRIKWVFKGCE